ncbi:MAG: AMP-binding protein [Pseudomonadota bacterium]|nr:AMP-binding protein [Pseudomonadota bacterium]
MSKPCAARIESYRTLIDALAANRGSDRGIVYHEAEGAERRVSYQSLYARALILLHELQTRECKRGDQLILFLNDNEKFIDIFWACLLGGIVPVPVAPGVSDEHRFKLFRIFDQLDRAHLYTGRKTMDRLAKFADDNALAKRWARLKAKTIPFERLDVSPAQGAVIEPDPDDIAFIQFSSGSTSEPKGVVLTHRNIIANIKAIIEGAKFTEADVSLSWMPLTHDMGLIGFHLNMMARGMNQHLMPTELFIRRPLLWLKAASDQRATILCSPNFGYKHFLKVFDSKGLDNVDLSHVRLIFNGAEPISVDLCEEFLNKMARFGLRRRAMFLVYGLAEASLAVTFPRAGAEYQALHVDRNALEVGRKVRFVERDARDGVSFAKVGRPLRYCDVRIADDAGYELGALTVGHVLIRGENVTRGYYNNDDVSCATITADGWLDTGDLGFVADDALIITGRTKEIIFVNGQNYYPHDLEHIAEQVEGLELGKVAVCGFRQANAQTDELLMFVLFRGKLENFVDLAVETARLISEHAGVEVTHVIPVARIPKTTSGKIQRHVLEKDYAEGAYEETLTTLARLRAASQEGDQITRTVIDTRLKEIVDAVLEDKGIGIHESLFEIGTSSLALVEIHERIEAVFPGQIDITDLFDYPTIAELAAHLEAKLNATA